MNVCCPDLFRDTELHLVLWARFDEPTHTAGLELVRSLLDSHEVDGEIMLFLRPFWRTTPERVLEPLHFQAEFREPDRPLDVAWCELWLQASTDKATELGDVIREWCHRDGGDNSRRAHLRWQGDGGPLWGPLSRGLQDCQYAVTRTGGAQCFLAGIPADQIAWLLKLIWHRATVAIADLCLKGASPSILDPRTDQAKISNLAASILADIIPGAYGIDAPPRPLDPSEYVASHLAVFALNAVTKVSETPQGIAYQLEDYYPSLKKLVTHPYRFASRCDYLRCLRDAKAARM